MRIAEAIRCGALAGALALGALGAQAGDAPSAAETAIFMTPHLNGLAAPATLHYVYRERHGPAAVDDSADLSVAADGAAGYRVSARFLSGPRQLALPQIEGATANPVVLYFLEHDVRRMHAALGGATNYFRRHIRLALAEAAQLSPVRFEFGGKTHEGTRVRIQPFRDAPAAARMPAQALKQYEFILSPTVPGGVYDLRTGVPDAGGAWTEQTSLTLDTGGS
jgi:hypothetical protein